MPFYYAVRKGKRPGIYQTWDECKAQVDGFKGCQYKKFKHLLEAEAFLIVPKPPNFDALKKHFTPEVNNFTPAAAATTVNKFTPAAATTVNNNHFTPTDTTTTVNNFTTTKNNEKNRFNPYERPKTKKEIIIGAQNFVGNNDNDNLKKNGENLGLPSVANFLEDVYKSSRKKTTLDQLDEFNRGGQFDEFRRGQSESTSGQFVASEPNQFASNSGQFESKLNRSDSNVNEVDAVVYTDGCCTKNGSQKARAGIGVYWGPGHPNNVSDKVQGRQTNNCAEIEACCRALQQARSLGFTSLEIKTDSQFLIDCVTKWMPGWKKKNWKTRFNQPVKNKVELMQLDQCQKGIRVVWTHVPGHAGIEGNEEADRLAKEGAKKT